MKEPEAQMNQSGDEILSEEFISLAKEHYLNDYPNPRRLACPPPEDLRKIAALKQLPGDSLQKHLLSCSPCLKDFQAARKLQTASPLVKTKASWLSVLWQPVPVAAMLILLIGFSGAIVYVWFSDRNAAELAQQTAPVTNKNSDAGNQDPISDAPLENVTLTNSLPEIKPAEGKNQRVFKEKPKSEKSGKQADASKPLTESAIRLDLSRAELLRSDNTIEEEIYTLPARVVHLNVKLPENSPTGNYEISLIDDSGKPLLAKTAKPTDGKKVRLKFDLRNKEGRARLCIAPKGEIPDCLGVKIGAAK